ncbi:MAG TPA: DUF2970 domain-containing protein [Moraxellaceae bacterium]|nr:DUF2970 domain-containing protein [Moraxellaceae bacterium]
MNEQEHPDNQHASPPSSDKKDGTGEGASHDVSALSVLGSVFRAWFGVQSEENRKRDFSSNNPTPFIVAGIIFALIMIIGVIIAVNIALSGVK